MLRVGGIALLLLALVSCNTPPSTSTPTVESSPTPYGHNPTSTPIVESSPTPYGHDSTSTPTVESSPTPYGHDPTSAPTVESSPTPYGHDPYRDGNPPRFLWYYPPPPEELTATPLDENTIVLEWKPVYGAAGYDVLYYPYSKGIRLTPENARDESLRASTYAVIGDMFTSQTSQQVSDLGCELTYLFEVRAIGAGRPYDNSSDPDQKDYGSPSRVIISPCDTAPAMSGAYAGLCPEEGTDCLHRSHWPPFQAVYSTLHYRSFTHDCADGQYYESRLQVKHMDYRATSDYRTTVIADFEWSYPEMFCSGSGIGSLEGVGSYEEQKGLIRTTYNALEDSGRVERNNTLSNLLGDFTANLYYLERIYGKDNPTVLILMGIQSSEGVQRPEGIPEDYDGVCYRNSCESENAAIRFGDDLVTNDQYNIPLVLGTLSRVGESLRVHQLLIDADRIP